MRTRHFIFGYGSLVCSKSRKITAPTLTKPAHPVIVDHLRRSWTARILHGKDQKDSDPHQFEGGTAMGIERAHGHNCTGVLIEVDSSELRQFDIREKGYDRVEIELHHVYSIEENHEDDIEHIVLRLGNEKRSSSNHNDDGGNSDNGDDVNVNVNVNENVNTNAKSDPPSVAKVWVYMPRQGTPANHKFPIYQSYVDIIVRGCMSISEDFTKKFLASTHGWWHEDENHHEGPPSYIWLDDRHAPYYVRADKEWSIEMKHIVDEYLKHSQEEPLQKRIHLDNIESIRRGMNSLSHEKEEE